MIVDIFVLVVVLISVVIAFLRGFIREILTIFGIIGGIIASYVGGPLLIPHMRGWMGVTEDGDSGKFLDILSYALLADILSYAAVFITFVIILSIISHFIAESVKNMGLGALDRTLGVVFGVVRAAVVLGLMYMPFYYLAGDEQKKSWFGESKSHVYLEISSSFIDKFIPRDMSDDMQDGMETAAKGVSDTRKKLEDMDVLKSKGEELSGQAKEMMKNTEGYSEEFRESMDSLVEQGLDNSPDYNE